MTHSYRVHHFHIVWSTKGRTPWLHEELQPRLFHYLSVIANNLGANILEVNGMEDHLHILLELSTLDHFTKIIRELKACSSQWIHKGFPEMAEFAWQEGYGSFSVSYSNIDKIRRYIQNQKQHHSKMTYDQEFLLFLKEHKINYDQRFVLG